MVARRKGALAQARLAKLAMKKGHKGEVYQTTHHRVDMRVSKDQGALT